MDTSTDSDEKKIQSLVSLLKREHADRKQTEDDACNIMRQFKQRYDEIIRKKDKKIASLEATVIEHQSRIDSLESKNSQNLKKQTRDIDYDITRSINIDLRLKIEELEKKLAEKGCKCKETPVTKTRDKFMEEFREKQVIDLRKKIEELEKARNEAQKLADERLSELNRKSKDADLLKQVCAEIETQANQFDQLLTRKQDENTQLMIENRNLATDRDRLLRQIDNHKEDLTSARRNFDRTVESLNHSNLKLEAQLIEKDKIIESLQRDLKNQEKSSSSSKEEIKSLTLQIQGLDSEIRQAYAELDASELKIRELQSDSDRIKEEAARHISELMLQRAENNRLIWNLDEAKKKIDDLETCMENLKRSHEIVKKAHADEIYSLEKQLRQHFGLETEMMKRIDKLQKAKKPLIAFSPYPKNLVRSIHSREQRNRERDRARDQEVEEDAETLHKLQEELIRAETELLDLKQEIKASRLSYQTSRSKNPSAPPPEYGDRDALDDSHLSSDNNEGQSSPDENIHYVQIAHAHRPVRNELRDKFAQMDNIISELDRSHKK